MVYDSGRTKAPATSAIDAWTTAFQQSSPGYCSRLPNDFMPGISMALKADLVRGFAEMSNSGN